MRRGFFGSEDGGDEMRVMRLWTGRRGGGEEGGDGLGEAGCGAMWQWDVGYGDGGGFDGEDSGGLVVGGE